MNIIYKKSLQFTLFLIMTIFGVPSATHAYHEIEAGYSFFNPLSLLMSGKLTPSFNNKTVLKLIPGPDNPRNSEGDFVTLKDGRIIFIYSHFIGTSGDDFGNAFLASRFLIKSRLVL